MQHSSLDEDEEDFPGLLLHQAALWENAELLEDLLEGDQIAHINSQDSWGRTPLHTAAMRESGCLRVLLQAGADPNIPAGPRCENRTALHLSAENGFTSNILLLLAHKADITARDCLSMTALDIAIKSEHTECVDILTRAQDAREQSRYSSHQALREAVLSGDPNLVKVLLHEFQPETELIVNLAPNGATTLLYCACESGKKPLVKLLLDHGADGRIHPVTRYSPLYIAAFKGHKDIVELILKTFPELIQQYTVERWLPLHASVINGHVPVAEEGEWEYEFPFDLNFQDVSGQTVLYLACFLGHAKLVDMLLKFKVKASRKPPPPSSGDKSQSGDAEGANPDNPDILSPTRRRISDGIQSIMSRLSLGSRTNVQESNEKLLSPWHVDMYCNNGMETALHAAVGAKQHEIAAGLVNIARANVNLSTRPNTGDQSISPRSGNEESVTPLVLACSNRDLSTVDLLLKAGARDDDCKALAVVAFPDPEYKINKKVIAEGSVGGMGGVYRSSIVANTPVMINWHAQRCELSRVRAQWLIDAGLHVNPKLRLQPRSQGLVLTAITRLDLSHNCLPWAPPALFQLPSLRVLNLAQNKIERLPSPQGGDFEQASPLHSVAGKRGRSEAKGYWLPVLEELYLQFNRLETIPEDIFHLPCLITLDLSNNKLQALSSQMWRSPKLKELNVAFNLLKELPTIHNAEDAMSDAGSVCSLESSRSAESNPDPSTPSPYDCDTRFNENRQNMKLLPLSHHNVWSHAGVDVTEHLPHSGGGVDGTDPGGDTPCCPLLSLNLAHNQFTSIPPVLPCLAVNLTKLNMAYNSLRSMSHITSYPNSLKQLDLSHNKISCWPSLPQIDSTDPMELAAVTCYCPDNATAKSHLGPLLRGRQSLRTSVLSSVCIHRRHLRLDSLRTLILADNNITRIQLSTDDDGEGPSAAGSFDELEGDVCLMRTRLMFPNLSMLDLSNNQLKDIPVSIHELSNLSVLNVSNNRDITELPYQMGLLSRLWNLNTKGCCLQEPLRSMIESNKYKTMDILGYLKSVLEDAKPYARMKLMIVGIQGIGKTSLLEQLRQEGVRSYKKKPVEHWAKRMGNKNINTKNSRGTNMSTVGVDIGDWVYEKRGRGSPHGPVTFRTWDFGGQREYYATHQYFLSKRSLYLVVWKIPDGQPAIDEILQWLVNIQARAPNSPCLIVGTHYDLVQEKFPASRSEDLQQLIRDRFINIVDAEKCGLPRVLDTIEISCKTRHNIKLLCNLIYDTVFSLRPPGSKELLLEQKVPASYLALEDVVGFLAADRKANGLDPVLSGDQYRTLVSTEMSNRCQRTFRDAAELHQATLFLHDNGVLLHYDDVTLRDLYFLDPQWLCDMLAHVVTIREINPFARAGLMQLSDLSLVFKNTKIGSLDTKGYIVNLLNKFEVALTWDSRTLLIPSLLPTEPDLTDPNAQIVKVKIPVRTRGWAVRHKKISATSNATAVPYFGTPTHDQTSSSTTSTAIEVLSNGEDGVELSTRGDPETAIRRLLLMSYFPSGFWSRLMTRILADDAVVDIVRAFFIIPKQVLQSAKLSQAIDKRAEWILWQTGMELRFSDTVLFRMREVLRIKQEGLWQDVDLSTASILEILLPSDTIVIKQPIKDENEPIGYQAIVLEPSPERTAQLLALAVDHIDVLLEDWYPTLGTRFVHTSEGKFLVTRLIPCPRCLSTSSSGGGDSVDPAYNPPPSRPPLAMPSGSDDGWEGGEEGWRVRKSQESYTSDGDSGVGRDSTCSSRKPSVEGHPHLILAEECTDQLSVPPQYSWMVEECILAAYDKDSVKCPVHGEILLAHIAPDTMFLDLGDRHLIRPASITRGKLLGRGAFGFVFKGSCKVRGSSSTSIDVAMKMLQPVQPGPGASQSAILAYQGAQGKWARDPLQYASKAYCTARQELNILLTLRHSNIVPLVGVCTRPLALVLDLAPLGALDAMLRHYRRSGASLAPSTLQQTILQIAKALEYLHQQHIIYRDLKSENVLVWSMPQPFDVNPDVPVHMKLADYGISRLTLPSGTKGFGGTEGFMAPEIMRYNGEEEYTEKVDCFSFGMFVYELLTLHQPFESHESVKECILEGGRPPLTQRETTHPSYMIDLMVLCWSHSPRDRPSASQIVSIASAPEFTHLHDVVSLQIEPHLDVVAAVATSPHNPGVEDPGGSSEVWLSCGSARVDLLLASERAWHQYVTTELPDPPTAMCVVNTSVWLGDTRSHLHAYSATDYHHMFSYSLLEDNTEESPVIAILFLPEQHRVVIGLSNGRIFLVRSDVPPTTPNMAEGSFVLTELGASSVLHAITAVPGELWCGESDGNISIYTMSEHSVTSHDTVNHFYPVISNVDVSFLVSSPSTSAWVWSYVYPGCSVYQWDTQARSIVNKLDCSKLVPCSESLQSICIEEPLRQDQCHVTSVCILDTCLYIGTTWGCIVVAEKDSLRPITVFRPYEELVTAILPLGGDIVTIGRGYRSLVSRYTNSTASSQCKENHFALLWSSQNWAAA
ncbi:hypothetical protein M8J75_009878 [Diaphorina citri]|nr:hypothetical protein M8J75_009878 [Diaphorina citri]